MSKLNFTSMNDSDLFHKESFLEDELDAIMINMVESKRIKEIFDEIKQIEEEKERRGL